MSAWLPDPFLLQAGATLALVALPAAWLGAVLHLRRMALLTDAMAHAALPGVVAAWLITGSLHPVAMAGGALGAGLAAAGSAEALTRMRRIRPDAAIAIVFPVALAAGVILLSAGVDDVHLDVECLLFGNLLAVHDDVLWLGVAVTGLTAAWLAIERRTVAMHLADPRWAQTHGRSAARVSIPLAVLVALASVVAFETVGAVAAVALVAVPGAVAHRLARSLTAYFALAGALGIGLAVAATIAVGLLDLPPAGTVAALGGVLVAAARCATGRERVDSDRDAA